MPTKPRLTREQIAARAARLLPDGAYVNLGWGIPNLIADHLPEGVTVYFHSENGILGMGRRARAGEEDFDLVDAMKVPVTLIPGASFFHQADAHLMTRGGHLDVAVLGAFQVSERPRARALLDGLSEGADVAVNPTDDLQEGVEVQIKPAEKPKSSPAPGQQKS